MTFAETFFMWLIPIVMLAICGLISYYVIYNWDDAIQEAKPPLMMTTYVPCVAAALLVVILISISWGNKYKLFMAILLILIIVACVWFNTNWDEEKKEGWSSVWQLWVLIIPGVFVGVMGLGAAMNSAKRAGVKASEYAGVARERASGLASSARERASGLASSARQRVSRLTSR